VEKQIIEAWLGAKNEQILYLLGTCDVIMENDKEAIITKSD
jgi:hypothetical protein